MYNRARLGAISRNRTFYTTLRFLFAIPVCHAILVNQTIDSNKGDPVTGFVPIYQPQSPWDDQTCSGCYIQPDISKAFDGTWNAATYHPQLQNVNFTLQFTGVAIWVFFILSNANKYGPGTTTNTQVNITLDGQHAGIFSHNPDLTTQDLIYNASIFSTSGLANTAHELVISTNDYPISTFINFDWAIYTVEKDAPAPPSQNTTTSTTSTTTSSTPAHTPSSPTPTPTHSTPSHTPTHSTPSHTPTHSTPSHTPTHSTPSPPTHSTPSPTPTHSTPSATPTHSTPSPPTHSTPSPTPTHSTPSPTPTHSTSSPTPTHSTSSPTSTHGTASTTLDPQAPPSQSAPSSISPGFPSTTNSSSAITTSSSGPTSQTLSSRIDIIVGCTLGGLAVIVLVLLFFIRQLLRVRSEMAERMLVVLPHPQPNLNSHTPVANHEPNQSQAVRLREARQTEMGVRIQPAQRQMSNLNSVRDARTASEVGNQLAAAPPRPIRSSLRNVVRRDQVGTLQAQREADLALSLSDETPPPAYTPH